MRNALDIAVLVTPSFNLSATTSFLDPFRAANYLSGGVRFTWRLLSIDGGAARASNGIEIVTERAGDGAAPSLGMVSSSWTPEMFWEPRLAALLRRWQRFGAMLGGIDTGAFLLAEAGLLDGRRATVHYEHLDALIERFPQIEAVEDLFVIDRDRVTAAGGAAAADLALALVERERGVAAANDAARYIFHERIRRQGERQRPTGAEPGGGRPASALQAAIDAMEQRLEDTAAIDEIASAVGLSTRALERLFRRYVGRTPKRYYADIRLDRARSLLTQTDMPVVEAAAACGFSSAAHFARAYRQRFGRPPSRDRILGRTPFEYRAWPMHPEPAHDD